MATSNQTPVGRSLVFYTGLIGLVEQEAARLLLQIEPSTSMVAIFAGFVLGAPAAEVLDRIAGNGGGSNRGR